MELESIIQSIYPISKNASNRIEDLVKVIVVKKNEIILNADKVENKMYFVKSGIVRAFSIVDGKEITFWFGKEGDVALSMQSYIHKLHGYEYLQVLEESELYEITITELQNLYEKDIEISNWGRKLAENELVKTEERFINIITKSAVERYHYLLNNQPEIISRIQLSYIASYLGIAQASLSRIRNMI